MAKNDPFDPDLVRALAQMIAETDLSEIEVGSRVQAGDKVLLVEAMKTFNEIVAPRAGTVTAVFIEDGQPVEFGEALLVIE